MECGVYAMGPVFGRRVVFVGFFLVRALRGHSDRHVATRRCFFSMPDASRKKDPNSRNFTRSNASQTDIGVFYFCKLGVRCDWMRNIPTIVEIWKCKNYPQNEINLA